MAARKDLRVRSGSDTNGLGEFHASGTCITNVRRANASIEKDVFVASRCCFGLTSLLSKRSRTNQTEGHQQRSRQNWTKSTGKGLQWIWSSRLRHGALSDKGLTTPLLVSHDMSTL